MEEFRLNPAQKFIYSVVLGLLIIGIIANLLNTNITLYEKIFIVGSLVIIATFLFLMLTRSKIRIEGFNIIRNTLTGEKRILISEIKSMKLKYNGLGIFSIQKSRRQYLKIELNNKKAVNLSIYSYNNADRLLDLLEKNTHKKVEGRK